MVNNRIGGNFYDDDDEESPEYKDKPSSCFRGPNFAIDLSAVNFVLALEDENHLIARIGLYDNPNFLDIQFGKSKESAELIKELIDAYVDFTDGDNLEEA